MCDFRRGWLTMRQARERLRVSRQRVDQLVSRGQLAAVWTPYGWLIEESGVERRLAASPAGTGRRTERPKPERCKHGHLLSGENLMDNGQAMLKCRTCNILNTRGWQRHRAPGTARGNAVERSDKMRILPAEIEEWKLMSGLPVEWP